MRKKGSSLLTDLQFARGRAEAAKVSVGRLEDVLHDLLLLRDAVEVELEVQRKLLLRLERGYERIETAGHGGRDGGYVPSVRLYAGAAEVGDQSTSDERYESGGGLEQSE